MKKPLRFNTDICDWLAVYITLITLRFPIIVLIDHQGAKYLSNKRYNIECDMYYAFMFSMNKIGKCKLNEDGTTPSIHELFELEKKFGERFSSSDIVGWYYMNPELELARKLYN